MVLAKILECQVLLANCWSCSLSRIPIRGILTNTHNGRTRKQIDTLTQRSELKYIIARARCRPWP